MKTSYKSTRFYLALLVAITGLMVGGVAASAQPVTIEFWSPFPPSDVVSGTALQKLVDDFNATHSDIKVEHVGISISELGERYLTAIAAGSMPDIGWGVPINFYSTENLVPVDTLAERDGIDTSQFWPGLWRGFLTLYGHQWGWPFEVGTQALVYNKDHFNLAGLGEAPRTWAEFLDYAKKLSDPESGRYALQPIWAPEEMISWTWRNRGSIFSDDGTQVTFTDPHTVDAVQWLGELESVHQATGGSVPGQSASMIVVHAGWYGFTQTFDFEVGYAMPPVPEGGVQTTRSYYQELTIVRSDAEHEQAAWTFLKWLMAPEQIVRWNVTTGYLPVSRDVVATAEYQDWLEDNPGITPWLEMLNYIRGLSRIPGSEVVRGLFMEALNEVRSGESSALAALSGRQEAAQAAWDRALADAASIK